MAGEKTEKATPKKKADARKKGQVSKSVDLSGAVVLMAGILALSAFAPAMVASLQDTMRRTLLLVSDPSVVSEAGIAHVFSEVMRSTTVAAAPTLAVCAVAAILINVVQVGLKPMPGAIKPQYARLNPINGAKKLFGVQHQAFEATKNIAKVAAVGAVGYVTLMPELDDLAALVGMPPAAFLSELGSVVLHVVQRTAIAYLLIAAADFFWQRYRFEKDLKMDKHEVRQEGKQQELPAEVRSAQRRRAMEMSRRRMMDAVPTADVVVTNPTHYAVALKYDSEHLAPVVVAKGKDHVAFRIRAVATEAGVTVVPDPPLARSLHGSVEIGQMIPEELYQAVAQLLAFVYRVAGRAAA